MRRVSAFTLIEIIIVLFITGMLASVFLPRISFYFGSQSSVLQRAFEEATDLALSGVSVRFQVKPIRDGRGSIQVQALLKREVPKGSISAFMGTKPSEAEILEWRNVRLKNALEGENWKFEPPIIYFFNDGSCTPAKISWAAPGTSDSRADKYVLTVTGYCVELDESLTTGY